MNVLRSLAVAALGFAVWSGPALGGVMVVQGNSAPTYATTLNFDEPGGPTGVNVPNNSWSGSPWDIISFQSGEGSNFVGDNSGLTNSGTNSYYGPFGVFIKFSQDLTEMSFDAWDSSGPPSFFGGGMGVFLINDGDENNPVFGQAYDPAWGGAGMPSFDITTTDGTVFDEVRILGFGFSPVTVVDNLSWNAIPEPGSLTLLALGGLAIVRRRRK